VLQSADLAGIVDAAHDLPTVTNSSSSSSSSSSGGRESSSGGSSSSGVVHPLGAQLAFPAAGSTDEASMLLAVDVNTVQETRPAFKFGCLSPLLNKCICWDSALATSSVANNDSSGSQAPSALHQLCSELQANRVQHSSSSSDSGVIGEQQMLSEVARLAGSEHWGPGFSSLGQYLSSNFYRAAVQGRLLVKTLNSSSSSDADEECVVEGEQQQQQKLLLLLFNTGLVTEAGQHVLMLFVHNSKHDYYQQQQEEEGEEHNR
jgi:hypothetical protein